MSLAKEASEKTARSTSGLVRKFHATGDSGTYDRLIDRIVGTGGSVDRMTPETARLAIANPTAHVLEGKGMAKLVRKLGPEAAFSAATNTPDKRLEQIRSQGLRVISLSKTK